MRLLGASVLAIAASNTSSSTSAEDTLVIHSTRVLNCIAKLPNKEQDAHLLIGHIPRCCHLQRPGENATPLRDGMHVIFAEKPL